MKYFFGIIFTVLSSVCFVQALSTDVSNPLDGVISAFQKYKDVSAIAISVPKVVEIPFSETFSNRFDFAVLDNETKTFQPYLFSQNINSTTPSFSVIVNSESRGVEMIDGNTSTFTEFNLPQTGIGQTSILIKGDKSLSLDGFTFLLDQYVALPTSIEIKAVTDTGEKIVLARSLMHGSSVVFPKTSAKEWNISLSYGQLLRITEIIPHFYEKSLDVNTLRFLAQPTHTYRVYFDSDRSVHMNVGESGNLFSNDGVKKLESVASQDNSAFVLADTDKDAIPDTRDNCVSVANADQKDLDGNGRGDMCDDFDKDGVMNNVDNCPDLPNYNQSDIDKDGLGDVCDKEESRVTEKYKWLPWVGIGFSAVVLVFLFAIIVRSTIKNSSEIKKD